MPGGIFRQYALEPRVVALDRRHRIIQQLADGRLLRALLQKLPARLLRHPKHILCAVLVPILWVCPRATKPRFAPLLLFADFPLLFFAT